MKKAELEKGAQDIRMSAVALANMMDDLSLAGGVDMYPEIVDYLRFEGGVTG